MPKCDFCQIDGNDNAADTGFLAWRLCQSCYDDAILQIAGALELRRIKLDRLGMAPEGERVPE